MRKIKRNIARTNMKRKGFTRLNKKYGSKNSSFFAENWRDFV